MGLDHVIGQVLKRIILYWAEKIASLLPVISLWNFLRDSLKIILYRNAAIWAGILITI